MTHHDSDSPGDAPEDSQEDDTKAGTESGTGSGHHSSASVLDALLAGIKETLTDVGGKLGDALDPQELADRVSPAIRAVLAQFELVPKQEFDSYRAMIERLETTVARLERRISELEQRELD